MTAPTPPSPTPRQWAAVLLPMAAILAVSAWLLSGRTFAAVASEARAAEIRGAFAAIPVRLGPWIGSDVPLPAGAREVLHATDTIARRYMRVGGGGEVTVALVHCGDVRDMLGHYPPACYPSQGWQLAESDGSAVVPLRVAGREGRAAIYRFTKPEREGVRSAITVVGAFLLPGAEPTPDASRLRQAARDRRVSSEGIGQLQFVFGGAPEVADIAATVQELVDAMPSDALGTLMGSEGVP